MYQISTGAAKSGKSALLVHMAQKLKEQHPELLVISNIVGHNVDINYSDWDADLVISEFGYNEYEMVTLGKTPFVEVNNKFPVLLIIDEAQRFFNNTFMRRYPPYIMNKLAESKGEDFAHRFAMGIPHESYFFFEYHAHLNYTILIATHNVRTLPQRLVAPAELINVVQRASKRILNKVSYFQTEGGRVEKESPKLSFQISEVKDQYVSSEHGELIKPPKMLTKTVALIAGFIVIALALFMWARTNFVGGDPELEQLAQLEPEPVQSSGLNFLGNNQKPENPKPVKTDPRVEALESRLDELKKKMEVPEDCFTYKHGKLCHNPSGKGEGMTFDGKWYTYTPNQKYKASDAERQPPPAERSDAAVVR